MASVSTTGAPAIGRYAYDNWNKITVALSAVGLIIALSVGSTSALKVLTPDTELLFEMTPSGSLAFGTGANALGASGECLKSAGGGLMTYGACAVGSTGLTQVSGDERYVNQSGDTMTGGLKITKLGGYYTGALLNVLGVASGAHLFGANGVSSSGTLVVEQRRIVGSGALTVDQLANSTGAYLTSRATSAPLLVLNTRFANSAVAPHILFGYNGTFDTNLYRASVATLKTDGSFHVVGTLSGTNLTVSHAASISGTLLVKTGITSKGSLSGSTFYGAGLGSCNGGSSKLLYNNATGKFECGSVSNLRVQVIGFSAVNPTTGQQGTYVVFPVAGTITGFKIVANAGTATIRTWKIASGTAAPTSANVISTSGVQLTTGTAIISSTTSDFTSTAVAANDIFAFDLTAVSGVGKIVFQLEITTN